MPDTPTVTERTTERNIARGTRFLRTLSLAPEIFSMLSAQAGYNQTEHEQGWRLLLAVMGRKAAVDRQESPAASPLKPAEIAISALDSYDGPAFARVRAALQDRYPEQLSYLLGGLSPATGARAVAAVHTFLDRYVTLRDELDSEREAFRDADQAAISLLQARHIISADIETELRGYIAEAQLAPEVHPADAEDVKQDPNYQQAAYDFHVWLRDWREQARETIPRRDYLIRLGLASRRSTSTDSPTPSEEDTSSEEDES